jgi:hypothetical protein
MNLYDATVPVFTKLLHQADTWLDKAVASAEQRKFDPEILLQARLAPDQYPLLRQLQSAADQAKFTCAKLIGKDPPSHPDTEKTIAEIRARLRSIIEYLATLKREDFNGAEERPCGHLWMQGKKLRGGDYLDHVALPNFHFHLTTAYAILRHNGVQIGKDDYLGPIPYLT